MSNINTASNRGLRWYVFRRCDDCADGYLTWAQYRSWDYSDDQNSPCECCGRALGQGQIRPDCEHAYLYDWARESRTA